MGLEPREFGLRSREIGLAYVTQRAFRATPGIIGERRALAFGQQATTLVSRNGLPLIKLVAGITEQADVGLKLIEEGVDLLSPGFYII